MDSNQLSMYSTLTFIYQIYLVMPAPPQFPDVHHNQSSHRVKVQGKPEPTYYSLCNGIITWPHQEHWQAGNYNHPQLQTSQTCGDQLGKYTGPWQLPRKISTALNHMKQCTEWLGVIIGDVNFRSGIIEKWLGRKTSGNIAGATSKKVLTVWEHWSNMLSMPDVTLPSEFK